RHRRRVPELQLQRNRLRADSCRPPLLHVLHAGGPRQLLAVQRRFGRRAALTRGVRLPRGLSAMSTTTLVTGAAGFAGSHLLDLLARDGADVVAWQRPGSPTPATIGRTRWESVDVLDAGAVRDAIARVRPHLVYHCAGAAHVGRAWDQVESTLATNVRGTHHLLDALRRDDLGRGADPGRAYNICSGRAVVIRDLLDMLLARARVPLRVRIDPKRYRPNDTPLLLGDPRRIRDELGWVAEIPIEQTLDDLLDYWRT